MPADASPPIDIRFVQPEDHAGWRRLWDGYNAFYEREGPTALPEEVTRTTWQRLLDPAEPMHCVVADHGGRLVGLAHYLFHRSTVALAPSCYLSDLFTDPSTRGRGVGRALIEVVYDRARLAGCGRVYWHTHESNATAQRLYDTLAEHTGFVVYRRML